MVDMKDRLRESMRARGHDPDARSSTAWLAGVLGVSYNAAKKLLNGNTKTMAPQTAAAAMEAFGHDLAYWQLQSGKAPAVAEPASRYVTVREAQLPRIEEPRKDYMPIGSAVATIGLALSKLPAPSREALATNLAGWARSGGDEPWQSLVLTLLNSPGGSGQLGKPQAAA